LAAVRAQVLASSPEEVERCIPVLNEAIACLQGLEPGHDASLLAELRSLMFEIGVVSRLVQRGAEFYQDWAKVLAATAAGYTATGDPAPLAAPGALSVKG
jgi:hypothetical protein